MLKIQKRRLKALEEIFKKMTDKAAELNTWLLHSEIVCFTMKVRVCEDIVVLLQHKNLVAEYHGRRYIKVGVIEKELGIMMKIPKFDPGQKRDFETRKLLNEVDKGGDVLEMLTRDTENDLKIGDEMRAFLTK